MRRSLRATLMLYPGPVRRRHGAELESLIEELIERDGRSRPAVMGRLAVDGLIQRLSSRATMWAMVLTLTGTSVGGLAVADIAAASAHAQPVPAHRSHPVAEHRGHLGGHQPHRIPARSAGIIDR